MFDISKLNFKPFVISLVIAFLVTSMHLLNVLPSTNKVLEPESIFPKVKTLLMEKKNNFKLGRKTSLINKAYATQIGADSYILVDLDTGTVIDEKNSNQQAPIASITKIMTAVVALDLANPSDEFTISYNAASQVPTKIGVREGEKMTLEELLNALLLTSANDAAEVIEEGINEKFDEKIFVRAMNEKARILGLKNTSFDNPQGFDSNENYSTSEDLAILSGYTLNNYPKIKDIVKKDFEQITSNLLHKQFDLYNWNGLVGVYPETTGFKIGYTESAGRTTIVVSEREGKRILAVLLGTPGILERDLWAANLLDIGYRDTLGLSPVNITPEQLQEKYNTWQY